MTSALPRLRVLFVDDEPLVLQGLRNLLRGQRRVWDVAGVGSAEAALAAMEADPYDVVVTDMRMPRLDGAALLALVRARWPQAVRMVLSGHTELDAAAHAVPLAHQFLAKPCEPDRLVAALARASTLRAMLADDALRRLVGTVSSLPTRPAVAARLADALADPETPPAAVAALVEGDVGLSAQALHVANSAFFGAARPVASVRDAVRYLGPGLVRRLVPAAAPPGVDLDGLARHATLVARVASRLAAPEQAAEAFTAGLLHDVGRLVLPGDDDAHGPVGGYLLGLWGLPDPLVDAVAGHHRAERSGDPTRLGVAEVVHLADALVHEADGVAWAPPAWVGALDLLGALPAWRAVVREETARLLEAA